MERVRLGVNVDHVATVRQARRVAYPDPVQAATLCELAGADQITIHLREDRRHIQDRDLEILRRTCGVELNLEMAATDAMCNIAEATRPDVVTLVPERREEVTTEGGLDVRGPLARLRPLVGRLRQAGIRVSMFIDPDRDQVDASVEAGATAVELHTGRYCEHARTETGRQELSRLRDAAEYARSRGLYVAAGHGLTYDNVRPVVDIEAITELNIGHSIVGRAIFVGLDRAVRDMRTLLERG